MLSTALEWAHCLVSPKHAETTWLRIKPNDEQLALNISKGIVIALSIACVAMWMLAAYRFGQVRMLQEMKDKGLIEIRFIDVQVPTETPKGESA